MTSPARNTVAHAIVGALEAEGTTHVFGMPGSHILSVFDALADSRIRCVSTAHESGAAFMAGMYGFLTGQPGVVVTTAGPGATNALTAVAQAYASSLPLVHISGDVPLRAAQEAFHGVDKPDFLPKTFREVTKWSTRLLQPSDARAVLARAFAVARSGRPGPVHISVPMDLGRAPLPDDDAPYAPLPAMRPRATPALVGHVVERLMRARRPMLCVCRGVLHDRAETRLRALAEALGAPVLSTAYGLGAFPQTHPLAVGTFSEFSKSSFAFELVRDSDFLLLVGLRPNTLMTGALAALAPKETAFLAFDEPGQTPEWPGPAETGSAAAFLDALLAQVEHFRRSGDQARVDAIAADQRCFSRGLAAMLDEYREHTPLHFGCAMEVVAAHLPEDAIVVSGVGNHHVWARNVIPVRARDSFIAEAAWGTMGGELGGAIAAKLVHPERTVVAITGDASLLMVAGDFVAAVKERAHVLVVVLNDGRHGIIRQMQQLGFGRAVADEIGPVDFAQLARSVGGVGIRVTTPVDLDSAVRDALQATARAPVLLDVVCDGTVPWPNRDKLVERGRALLEDER